MLTTNPHAITPALKGVDNQNWSEIQKLDGLVPYQVGLQKKLPGKTLQRIYSNEIGSIYVFYLVYGRFYTLVDFGSLEISPVVVPPITPPALPPNQTVWWDDFSGYSPNGVISKIWSGGAWQDGIGICETIIQGYFDPFMGGAVTPPQQNIQIIYIPVDPITPVDPTSPPYFYPPGLADVVLKIQTFTLIPPSGDETLPQDVVAQDTIDLFDYPLPPEKNLLDTFIAESAHVGKIVVWNGLAIGRTPDQAKGDFSMGGPGQPHFNPDLPWPPPSAINYYKILTTGEFGTES